MGLIPAAALAEKDVFFGVIQATRKKFCREHGGLGTFEVVFGVA